MDDLDLAYMLLEANVDVQVPIAARGGPISLRRVPQPVLDLQDLDDPRVGKLLERCTRNFQRRQRLRAPQCAVALASPAFTRLFIRKNVVLEAEAKFGPP